MTLKSDTYMQSQCRDTDKNAWSDTQTQGQTQKHSNRHKNRRSDTHMVRHADTTKKNTRSGTGTKTQCTQKHKVRHTHFGIFDTTVTLKLRPSEQRMKC